MMCIASMNTVDSVKNKKDLQNGLYIVGGIGAIITARSIYMTKVFTKVEDIPAQFIRKQVKLRGKVKEVNDEGILSIEHIPIWRLRVPFIRQNQTNECLPVHLACIDLSPEGRLWLSENTLHKVVWFHLLHRTGSHNDMGSHLYSKIEIPQRFRRNIQVNEELIRQGLSKISSLSCLEDGKMPTNKNLLLYLDRLVQLENHASKKGVGMWTQQEESSWTRKGLKTVGYILTSPVNVLKWIYKKWKRK
ncbi:protein C3orf33 homolog isoform X2 [Mercenaria mercenaria]|uniref:protein C3orf33 homolog isoform X2 n=1 Tax=Mercenaria mercenaria TaxID=6596 RepID=UPI00234EE128|nr:protein C3orf33 homolog isoform X2 [Mercenaria mercenaria]